VTILYLETNFPWSIAKGQDRDAETILSNPPTEVQLTIPSVCFMEALSVLNNERKLQKKLVHELGSYATDARRNVASPLATTLYHHLNEARINSEGLLSDIETSLYGALARLSEKAVVIDLSAGMISASLKGQYIVDPTDNLILVCILEHAQLNPAVPKAFLSGNYHDFDEDEARSALDVAGVHFFSRTEAALGWLQTQQAP
jgi:hypothetical protein